MAAGQLLLGGTAAAAASPAGHCQTPAQGRLSTQTTNGPPRGGVAEPGPVPMGTHPPSTRCLPGDQSLLLSLAKARICCAHGAQGHIPALGVAKRDAGMQQPGPSGRDWVREGQPQGQSCSRHWFGIPELPPQPRVGFTPQFWVFSPLDECWQQPGDQKPQMKPRCGQGAALGGTGLAVAASCDSTLQAALCSHKNKSFKKALKTTH